MAGRSLTPEQIDEIRSRGAAGESARSIAEKVGSSRNTVVKYLAASADPKPAQRGQGSPSQRAGLYGSIPEISPADKAIVLADLERRGLADDLADMLGLRPAVSS
ncbi:hypothetical protein C5B92_16180 [Rathayibacter sp. AY1A4]|uniref:helix-turn-helix domain-containing protein n=1 Tax=Rathayibacter sp. AY1A4 TaxID=2080522 RepID=UPI000CE7F72F|nr:helix-turn-helix domain-containing protein [Rathayibacter sp. AY1A4]PPF13761.1 hypothetical protein C5B92_16180 [Rathayibacter sp. AY1A4]